MKAELTEEDCDVLNAEFNVMLAKLVEARTKRDNMHMMNAPSNPDVDTESLGMEDSFSEEDEGGEEEEEGDEGSGDDGDEDDESDAGDDLDPDEGRSEQPGYL